LNNVQSKVNNRILVFDSKGKVNLFKKNENKYEVDKVLSNFKTFDGASVNFDRAFLHNNDSQLVTTSRNDNGKTLNIYDVETEQLIKSFDTTVHLTDITPDSKTGAVNQCNTL